VTPILALFARRRLSGWLAGAVCLSAAALVWIGDRAVVEWKHAAAQVASRRADAAADLLVAALARDMRGAQQLVLSSADRDGLTVGRAVDLLHPIGSAFARYPYTDAFFSWRGTPEPGSVVFYGRAERHPGWLNADDDGKPFPVIVGREPLTAARLVDRVAKDVAEGRRFSIFDATLAGVPYQVVALISYTDALRQHPAAVLGYLVDLAWTRAYYFKDLAEQVARIEGADHGVRFTILDAESRPVVGTPNRQTEGPAARRQFPLAFFDPSGLSVDPPADLSLQSWIAVATAQDDPALAAAERGARRALGLAAVMALVLTGSLVLSLQAGRASANLAEMRSDFVSAVTHELKTPIANMRAIHETLASGRSTIEMSREYAQMGIREAVRLTRLIDNLLAYARITDVADAYSFERVSLDTIVERSVREFAPNLAHGGFDVQINLPEDLPAVRADPTALNLMLNNLVDNAIRYSKQVRHLRIEARSTADTVTLEVADQGIGIPSDEIPRVTRKFSRGQGSEAGGSGLGLAIVDRIVTDHGGTLAIHSRVGSGTSVVIMLPVAH
jgi:signal transduction histidine kinase